jgi:hypothetical protein
MAHPGASLRFWVAKSDIFPWPYCFLLTGPFSRGKILPELLWRTRRALDMMLPCLALPLDPFELRDIRRGDVFHRKWKREGQRQQKEYQRIV